MVCNLGFEGLVEAGQIAAVTFQRGVILVFGNLIDGDGERLDELLESQIGAPEIVVRDGLPHVRVAFLEDLAQRRMGVQVDGHGGQVFNMGKGGSAARVTVG